MLKAISGIQIAIVQTFIFQTVFIEAIYEVIQIKNSKVLMIAALQSMVNPGDILITFKISAVADPELIFTRYQESIGNKIFKCLLFKKGYNISTLVLQTPIVMSVSYSGAVTDDEVTEYIPTVSNSTIKSSSTSISIVNDKYIIYIISGIGTGSIVLLCLFFGFMKLCRRAKRDSHVLEDDQNYYETDRFDSLEQEDISLQHEDRPATKDGKSFSRQDHTKIFEL